MRLAYLSHYFPPESNAPAARVHELSRALVELGHEVHVVTGQPSHPRGVIYPGYRAAEYRHEARDGIQVHRVPTFPAANRGVVLRGLGYAAMRSRATPWARKCATKLSVTETMPAAPR